MDDRDQLPEFVRDTELATEFRTDRAITVHFRHLDRKKREFWHRQQPPIGHGGYGLVWLERQIDHHGTLSDSKLRAVKQIRLSSTRTALEDYVRELEAIAKFSQDKYADYFVKSTGWFMDPESLFIAMEYCPCGDLKKYLEAKGAVGEENAKIIVPQILKGLAHMHREKFAHRDLKPANFLLVKMPPDEWLVKLSDFGLTKRAVGLESTTVKGTIAYLPPELMEDNARRSDHFAGDIWCVGETAFELITGATAFGGNVISRFKYTQDVTAFPTTELEKANASPEASGFIMSTMAASPSDRPTASQALDDPWILEDEIEHSPQIPSIQGAWPDIPSLGPTIEGTNTWSTGLGPESTAFTLPTSEASPVPSPAPDSIMANEDMDRGLREAQKEASKSDQGKLVKHEVDPRTSPRHAVIDAIPAEAVTKHTGSSNEDAADDQFASEDRTLIGRRGTRSDPPLTGSQASRSANSLKVSSQSSAQKAEEATVRMPEKPAGYSSASSIDGTPKRAGQATQIKLYNWDDHSVSRKRPHIDHVIRKVSTTDGKLFLGRAQPGSFDYFVVGFKSKVVSRDHAVIRFQGEQCTIQDLGSASGTFLKGKRLSAADSRSEPHVLRNYDVVRLGTDYSEHTEDSTYGAVQFIVELVRLT